MNMFAIFFSLRITNLCDFTRQTNFKSSKQFSNPTKFTTLDSLKSLVIFKNNLKLDNPINIRNYKQKLVYNNTFISPLHITIFL